MYLILFSVSFCFVLLDNKRPLPFRSLLLNMHIFDRLFMKNKMRSMLEQQASALVLFIFPVINMPFKYCIDYQLQFFALKQHVSG